MNDSLKRALDGMSTVVILGHLHPDGDCVGSTLGLCNYLKETMPELKVDLFLDHPAEKFSYLTGFSEIKTGLLPEKSYELCITLDSSDKERLGVFLPYFETAGRTICIDHHRTNPGFAMDNVVVPDASSCCEVLYELLDAEKISLPVAECLYTGIVHDTGVFKYNNTSRRTMEIAGELLSHGIDCAKIIDDSFYRKTYVQNQILGRALLESILFMDGRCIFSALSKKELDFYGADSKDVDGIIDQLRITAGVECAIFIYEKSPQEFKVSLRSNQIVDVSKIASYFGGGGHIRAAGCTMMGSSHDVLNNLSKLIAQQMDDMDKRQTDAE